MEHYLDNSATTRVSESSAKAVMEMMTENFGNPSSLHSLGIRAESVLESSRGTIADALGVTSGEIYFTSGGTEANNLAVFGAAEWLKKRGKKIVTTAIEHSSVYEAMQNLEENGFEVVYIEPDNSGHITADMLREAIDEKTILVSVMAVNNEVGTILPFDKIKKIITENKSPALLHCDCVQAFGKLLLRLAKAGVDLATVSGHKIHAPKGVGALYVRKKLHIKPRVFGGEQEKKLRPGTEPLPLIAGFAQAVRDFELSANYKKVSALNTYINEKLRKLDFITVNSPADALPYIVNFSVEGIRSETMLHFLAQREIYVSSGSACSKGKPSRVLSAMKLPKNTADSALRVSFSHDNTTDNIDALISAVTEGYETLAKRK